MSDFQIKQLCRKIEEVSCQEPYMGERMPIRWIQFEQQVQKLVAQGFNYASYDQVILLNSYISYHSMLVLLVIFVCVEVLRPIQPNGVMLSAVSLL